MNDNIEFRFVTRTLREDYRVYADDGSAVYSDQTEFAPFRQKCSIIPEDGGCAALFEENAKKFLVVSALSSGRKDFAGRPIRFSFCKIFQERAGSFASFIRVVTQWEKVEAKIQELFHEKADGVSFEHEKFIDWLQAEKLDAPSFETCKHGDVRGVRDVMWPSQGCVIKWLHSEPDEIFCM